MFSYKDLDLYIKVMGLATAIFFKDGTELRADRFKKHYYIKHNEKDIFIEHFGDYEVFKSKVIEYFENK